MSESDYFFQVTGELGVPYGTFILTCKLASISTSQVDPKISHRLFSQLSPAIFELSPQPFRRLRLSWVSSIWQAMATWDLIWLDVWVNRLVYLQQQKCWMSTHCHAGFSRRHSIFDFEICKKWQPFFMGIQPKLDPVGFTCQNWGCFMRWSWHAPWCTLGICPWKLQKSEYHCEHV